MTYTFVSELSPNNAYHFLIREWNGQTWELGPIYEVKIDKNEKASRLSALLSENIFKTIDPEHLVCSKVSVT